MICEEADDVVLPCSDEREGSAGSDELAASIVSNLLYATRSATRLALLLTLGRFELVAASGGDKMGLENSLKLRDRRRDCIGLADRSAGDTLPSSELNMLSKVDPRLKSRVGSCGRGRESTGGKIEISLTVDVLSVDSIVWLETGLLMLDCRPGLPVVADDITGLDEPIDSGGCRGASGSVTRRVN